MCDLVTVNASTVASCSCLCILLLTPHPPNCLALRGVFTRSASRRGGAALFIRKGVRPIREWRPVHSHGRERQCRQGRGRLRTALRRVAACAVLIKALALGAHRRQQLAVPERLRPGHRRRLPDPGAG